MSTSTVRTSGDFSNVSLGYTTGSGSFYFLGRCSEYGHGYEVIATESHARQFRAFYPRQRAFSPFFVTMLLKGYPDLRKFVDFIRGYMQAFMVAANNAMSVTIHGDGRDPNNSGFVFSHIGVPIAGVPDGDHVGSMLFQPTIYFQSLYDPLDQTLFTTLQDVSQVNLSTSQADEAAKFFYPVTASSNDPNATGESLYDAAPIPTAAGGPIIQHLPGLSTTNQNN